MTVLVWEVKEEEEEDCEGHVQVITRSILVSFAFHSHTEQNEDGLDSYLRSYLIFRSLHTY